MLWKMLFFLQDMVRFKIRVSLFEYKSRVKSQDTSSEAAVPHVSSEDSDSRRRSRDQEIRSSPVVFQSYVIVTRGSDPHNAAAHFQDVSKQVYSCIK